MAAGETVEWIGKPVVQHAWGEGEISQAKTRLWRIRTVALKVGLGLIPAIFLTLGFFGVIEEMFRNGWPGIGQVIVTVLLLTVVVGMALGLWIIVMSPLFMMWQAGRTDYVLTNQRAFVFCEFKGGVSVRKWNLRELSPEVLRETDSGVGDVVFGAISVTVHSLETAPGATQLDVGFHSVRNPHGVVDRICSLRDAEAARG